MVVIQRIIKMYITSKREEVLFRGILSKVASEQENSRCNGHCNHGKGRYGEHYQHTDLCPQWKCCGTRSAKPVSTWRGSTPRRQWALLNKAQVSFENTPVILNILRPYKAVVF